MPYEFRKVEPILQSDAGKAATSSMALRQYHFTAPLMAGRNVSSSSAAHQRMS
jgi:hypothetical protein